MAQISKSVQYEFILNGERITPPQNWQELVISISKDTAENEANVTTERLEFVGTGYTKLLQYIEDGKQGNGLGITEGVPLQIVGSNNKGRLTFFDGFVNLLFGAQIDEENGIIYANIKRTDNKLSLEDRLEGITFDLLREKGFIPDSKFVNAPYVVDKLDSKIEVALSAVTTYIMVKESADFIRFESDSVATTAGISSAAVTGGIGATVYKILSAVVTVVYIAAMIATIVKLGKTILNATIPAVRQHKVMSLYALLEVLTDYLGYELDCDIEDTKKYFYLPPNVSLDEINDRTGLLKTARGTRLGYPTSGTSENTARGFLLLISQLFNTTTKIVDRKLIIRNKASAFFNKPSSVRLPSIPKQNWTVLENTFIAYRQLQFSTDSTDLYTLDKIGGTDFYEGNNCIAQNEQITRPNNGESSFIEGSEIIKLNVALAARRDNESIAEKIFKPILKLISSVTGVLGNNNTFRVRSKPVIGAIKQSNNNFFTPKLVYLEAGKVPSNHRQKLSAEYLMRTYHLPYYGLSKEYGFAGQKIKYEAVQVPLTFENLQGIIENDTIQTFDGRTVTPVQLDYEIGEDLATLSYWEQETLTQNIQTNLIK